MACGSPAVAARNDGRVMESLFGLDESKWSISQRLAVALEQPTLHNYGPSIRTVMEIFP